jgi:hypothetical protein
MNATNMPIAPSATVRHKIAFRQCKDFNRNATVHVISSHNPWRPNALGFNLFDKILRTKPVTTVDQVLKDAAAIGYDPVETMKHLRWLYTWGDFIEVNGQRHFPKEMLTA